MRRLWVGWVMCDPVTAQRVVDSAQRVSTAPDEASRRQSCLQGAEAVCAGFVCFASSAVCVCDRHC